MPLKSIKILLLSHNPPVIIFILWDYRLNDRNIVDFNNAQLIQGINWDDTFKKSSVKVHPLESEHKVADGALVNNI